MARALYTLCGSSCQSVHRSPSLVTQNLRGRISLPRYSEVPNADVGLHQPVASKTIRSWTERIGEHIRKEKRS
jgi:hypothetical protein